MKNFRVVEDKRRSFDDIYDDFKEDYLNSSMKNEEIRLKYQLTYGEFRLLAKQIKSEVNLSHRNRRDKKGKYYYKYHSGFSIQKRINGNTVYLGSVPTKEMAEEAIKICEKLNWQINKCKLAIWELKLCHTT